MAMDNVKTAGTVISIILGASGLWFGVGKDVGAGKVATEFKAEVATVRSDQNAAKERLTKHEQDEDKKISDLKQAIKDEGKKTRDAMRNGVRNARGEE